MADTSYTSATGEALPKSKSSRKRTKGVKPAAAETEKDVHLENVDDKQDSMIAPLTSATEKTKRTRPKDSQQHKPAAIAAAGGSGHVATASEEIERQAQNTVKPLSKGKGKVSKQTESAEHAQVSKLPFLRLSEPLGKSAHLAPVFSHDGRFCFVAAASSVKIYLVSSCQLLSTLDLPTLSQPNEVNSLNKPNNQITSIFINPNNGLQLITSSLDGFVRVWDYLEGKVLYSADMGGPIPCAAMVQSDSLAFQQVHLKETLFLAVNRGASITETATGKSYSPPTSIVFCISLKRSEISHQIRLGKCRDAVGLSVSSDGNSLVVIGKKKIHIASFTISKSGSIIPKGSFISFEGFPSTIHYREVTFTTVLCHPSESYFATGDTRGTIRLWYILTEESLNSIRTAQEKKKENNKGSKKSVDIVPNGAMAVLHWHAHAVSSLAFTPNGAYLLSGGEESVLVVWQIASRHKEFVPRVGAPIEALTIINNGQSGQQEFVARLKDGAIVFLGAGTLKVLRTIAGVKTIEQFSQKQGSDLPLAIEPLTNRLVFQASHPSTIQFYSATQDTHVYEQDISPSNRVSRTDDRPIEPVRVEQIAFCASGNSPTAAVPADTAGALQVVSGATASEMRGSVWMATFDTWKDRNYTRESHLKFWMGFPSYKPGYGLVSRIDNPHGEERISSMSFSPPSSLSTSNNGGVGKLVTTSLDGTIKLWNYKSLHEENAKTKKKALSAPQGIWQCLFLINYRSYGAIKGTFSKDGSLLAILHNDKNNKITLWNSDNGNFMKVFSANEEDVGGKVNDIAFAGINGTRLIAGGDKGHVIWDLLTFEEVETSPIPAHQIITPRSSAPSDLYTVVSEKSSTTLSLSDESYKITHPLPFALAHAALYPSSPSSNPSTELVIAAIAKSGQVALLGSNKALHSIRPAAFEDNASLQAALNTVEVSNENLRPVRLFDELFGESSLSSTSLPSTSTITSVAGLMGGNSSSKRDIFDEIPSHKLPSLSNLWRDLITPGLLPVAGPSSSASTGLSKSEAGEVKDEEEDSDEDDGEDEDEDDARMEEDQPVQSEEEEDKAEVTETKEDLTYVNLPEEDLVQIFSKSMDTFSNVFKGQGIPSDRIAGKTVKDKKKKRKSLLASMV